MPKILSIVMILQVQPALDFLLASGLGDPDADVRELMVTAGVRTTVAQGLVLLKCHDSLDSNQRVSMIPATWSPWSCSGVALVDAHGGQHSAPMLALFERYLDGPAAVGADEDTYDRVREGLVVLLGTLARHLPPQDPKVQLQSEPAT